MAAKTDKIIIEIAYDKSSVHFTDEQMEEMVNRHMEKILSAINEPSGPLRLNVMALASMWATKIYRESQIEAAEEKRAKNVPELAKQYHDRLVFSGSYGFERNCPCCEDKVHTTTSIEHDSMDFNKDLNVCVNCYLAIHKEWENKAPRKISPI